MNVTVSSVIPLPADQTWALVKRSDTLTFITKGLIGFTSLNGGFPEQWIKGRTEDVRILLFGAIPAWPHHIHFAEIDHDRKTILTNEAGGAVTQWNHLMSVKAIDAKSSEYTDCVDIEAGVLTPFVCAYAKQFYRYRHRRWQKLAAAQ